MYLYTASLERRPHLPGLTTASHVDSSNSSALFCVALPLAIAFAANCLHELKELSDLLICSNTMVSTSHLPQQQDTLQHTAHPVQLGLVQLLSSPIITLQLLRVELPLCQEPDLPLPVSSDLVEPSPSPRPAQADIQCAVDSPHCDAPETPSSRMNRPARASPVRACGGRAGSGGTAAAAGGGPGLR